MQWIVLKWNEGARRLYARIGAEDLTVDYGYHVATLWKDKFTNFVEQDIASNASQDVVIL